jgi:hypothetical protein
LELQKFTGEQTKLWLNDMNNNWTSRIEDTKNYILHSNQAMREMISNGIGDMMKELRIG